MTVRALVNMVVVGVVVVLIPDGVDREYRRQVRLSYIVWAMYSL